jgi:thiosulfate dehydrogenase
VVPRFAAMLTRPNADQLIYGMRLMAETKAMLPDHVGDSLTCNSCHLVGGTVAHASPYVGLSALFPSYAPRAGKIIDFKDRVNGCMRRSMNGKVLEKNSREMLAMVAYMDNMKSDVKPGQPIPGRGIGKISHSVIPDVNNGKQVYKDQCAVCHGDNGEGIKRADGSFVFPPLWGNQSFNIGAGIAKTYTAAAFVKSNMPMSNTMSFPLGQGGLTDQQAVDVAAYFTHMPRPDFPDKVKDWPNGGKPDDSRY